MKLLSFVIPCYRSEKTIENVIDEIISVVQQKKEYDYEIILVNDCSPDDLYSVIMRKASENSKVKVLNLAKNNGKHSAVLAGYSIVKGDVIVNLDDDMQCPTHELWRLIEPIEKNIADVTFASYFRKKESILKRMGSWGNLKMTEILLDKEKGVRWENFYAMKCYVAKEMARYTSPFPYLEGLIYQVTRNIVVIPMEERSRGDDNTTGYTLKKSVRLLLNGLTSFSVKPLRIAAVIGFFFAFIGGVLGVAIVFMKMFYGVSVEGYSSIMAVLLLSMGLNMIMLGLIGEYLGRAYICINHFPQYTIKDSKNVFGNDNSSMT